ncbi:hypothetical protein SELMODRAFT_228161 [Selaginella moellendorffii]|uniref:PRELI/MSF1 domain-containing protein n=1 Tax=Selaginella moellendorffii TaxID=88036 RepID=D8RPD4_SELML|nr:protein slowmo homolog [Selaginella moellendorffii]EFJ26240.1 hypothetical protein SELMODRAFT_228161 [Selaginella moellendorffii]|eukprot:XP_002973019.1 protein slowmo homolog [Selaginella moellendorffii]
MVRGYKQEHVYKHPWDRVTAATWRKYQDLDNKPQLSHVLSVDTIARRVDGATGVLESTRLVSVNAPCPWWLQRIIGDRVCHCIERSSVDAAAQTMQIVTRNVTLKDFVEVEEKCWCSPHPQNPDWTLFRQEMNIRCSTLSALASLAEKIEQRCIEKFQQNSAKGRQVMEQLCAFLEKESSLGGS